MRRLDSACDRETREENESSSHATQFSLLRRIGDGSYSDVYLARNESTGEACALKVVDKYHVIKHHAVEGIRREKRLLERMRGEDSIVRILFTYQDSSNLYIGLEFCKYGELYDQIEEAYQSGGGMGEERVRVYAAEIVVMLETLRKHKVIHRDLKPENILLGEGGHLKLIDFGCAKDIVEGEVESCEGKRAVSLVGTAEYVPPEVLENSGEVTYAVDLWALGCIIYQMCTGQTPFKGRSEYLTFQNIVKNDADMRPVVEGGGSREVCDVIEGLLQSVPEERLGYESLDGLKSHEFFKGIAWDSLYREPNDALLANRIASPREEEEEEEFDWELRSLMVHLQSTSVS